MNRISHVALIFVIAVLISLPVAAHAGTGGPDTFGYTRIDGHEPGGPVYDRVDISGVGTPVPFASYVDDGNVGSVPIGFAFPFHGNNFSARYQHERPRSVHRQPLTLGVVFPQSNRGVPVD